jgi:hypothetical protein
VKISHNNFAFPEDNFIGTGVINFLNWSIANQIKAYSAQG